MHPNHIINRFISKTDTKFGKYNYSDTLQIPLLKRRKAFPFLCLLTDASFCAFIWPNIHVISVRFEFSSDNITSICNVKPPHNVTKLLIKVMILSLLAI